MHGKPLLKLISQKGFNGLRFRMKKTMHDIFWTKLFDSGHSGPPGTALSEKTNQQKPQAHRPNFQFSL